MTATAAESAGMPSAAATTTSVSTAAAVLSKGGAAHGQKRRQGTDRPQGGPITEKTALRLHDAYSDAGFFQVAGTASRPNRLDLLTPPTFKQNALPGRRLTGNVKRSPRGDIWGNICM
jgi:hypothetical protein